ncbi:hypothetical protein [Methanosarcina mazei]|nr:hypothetical protein [Methanosarcina mazei]
MKKELLELKRAAALENKNSEDYRIKNMTDEELQDEIDRDLKKLGFKSQADFIEAAKNFVLVHDPGANVTHDYAIEKRFFELTEDFKVFEEFLRKYSILELEQ